MPDQRVPAAEVKDFYNRMAEIWQQDQWHTRTRAAIESALREAQTFFPQFAERVLHLGSAGENYGIDGTLSIHVDLADKRLAGVPNAVASDLHQLPFADNQFDLCSCIGSVLNYCDAAVAIAEIGRVIKAGGYLVLEFETTDSWEYLGKPHHRRAASLVKTFYGDGAEVSIWAFSQQYVRNLLEARQLSVQKVTRIHVASSAGFRIFGVSSLASRLSFFDKYLNIVPGVRSGASNVILFCRKIL